MDIEKILKIQKIEIDKSDISSKYKFFLLQNKRWESQLTFDLLALINYKMIATSVPYRDLEVTRDEDNCITVKQSWPREYTPLMDFVLADNIKINLTEYNLRKTNQFYSADKLKFQVWEQMGFWKFEAISITGYHHTPLYKIELEISKDEFDFLKGLPKGYELKADFKLEY